ncbi:MAG: shikimate dehydrogenase [Muribaculaceae bacterium]|nr:shikimate dehydrogenase [Muribaculaceae bacterium]
MSRKELFGLVGYPLGHSFSESFFNNKFNSEGIDAQYLNFEIPNINEFRNIINTNTNLRGLNVTIPYKEQVIPYLDDIDITASEIGAVNVVKFIRNGNNLILKGFNSDVIGFCNSLKPLLKPHHTHALVLGTGGAAKAITHGLKSLGIEPIYVSRTKKDGVLTYNELTPGIIEKYQVIVNTTPAGMYPLVDTCPDIPYHLLTPQHLCYDVVYNPEVTLFMKKSQEQGAVVKNGLEMLILQALAAWEIWNS